MEGNLLKLLTCKSTKLSALLEINRQGENMTEGTKRNFQDSKQDRDCSMKSLQKIVQNDLEN